MRSNALTSVALLLLCITCCFSSSAWSEGLYCPIVSMAEDVGNGTSTNPSYSRDGSILVFHSGATVLVPGDTNARTDVFLLEKATRGFEIVSLVDDDVSTQGNGNSQNADVSADGRYVTFLSTSTNLVSNESGSDWDVFLRDRVSSQTELISISDPAAGHVPADFGVLGLRPRISANGCRIVFSSQSKNLVVNWPDIPSLNHWHVFLRDRCVDKTILVSRPEGGSSTGSSGGAVISADGRYVAFSSRNNRLPGASEDGSSTDTDVFVYDVEEGEIIQRMDFDSMPGGISDGNLAIDGFGRFVVGISNFQKSPNDTNALPDAYVVAVRDDAFQLVSHNAGGGVGGAGTITEPSISHDARFIAFNSERDHSGELPSNAKAQVWVHDRLSDTTQLISKRWDTGTGDVVFGTGNPRISPSGSAVAFTTHANLDPRDTSYNFAQLYEGSGHAFEFLDPNPELLTSAGAVTSEVDRLAVFGRPVIGLSTDGVTKVLLRVRTTQPNATSLVRFTLLDDVHAPSTSVGTLSTVGGSEEDSHSLDVPVEEVTPGQFYAFAILTAPESFDRDGHAEDEISLSRRVFVGMQELQGSSSMEMARDLLRPPVTFVHGLWGSRDSYWEYEFLGSQHFDISLHDYKATNAEEYSENMYEGFLAAWDALSNIRRKGYAATQVDFVAHSMGGILGRQWAAGDHCRSMCYLRPDNFFTGDFNRLITIGTPHKGSEFADVLAIAYPEMNPYEQGLFRHALGCIDCGAVEDLQTYSSETTGFREASVPSHAIVGTGGQTRTPELLRRFLNATGITVEEVFGSGVEHDAIVSRDSQEGRLSSAAITVVPPSESVAAVHTTEAKEDAFGEIVEALLHLAPGSGSFEQGGFPPATSGTTNLKRRVSGSTPRIEPMDMGGVILCADILEGSAPYRPGDSVTLGAWGCEGYNIDNVTFFFGEQEATLNASQTLPQAEVTFTIPSEHIGDLWWGALAEGHYSANTLPKIHLNFIGEPINVVLDSSLLGLLADPPEIVGSFAIPGRRISFSGVYDDGIKRRLSPSSLQLQSLDSTIASVSADGFVRFLQPGTTSIGARIGQIELNVPVDVQREPLVLELVQQGSKNAVFLVDKLVPGQSFALFGSGDGADGVTPVVDCPRLDLNLNGGVLLPHSAENSGGPASVEFAVSYLKGSDILAVQVVGDDCAVSNKVVALREP